MTKYNFEFKKKIVLEYLNGYGGTHYLSQKYNLGSNTQLRKWIGAYRSFGDKGLLRSHQQRKYTFEYKLHVVELYLSSEVSYQELALQEGFSSPSTIVKWVNDYRIAGPDALRSRKKGRKKILNSKDSTKKVISNGSAPIDSSTEYIKQLEDELLKLRIENAYLKELRRLRLEEETLLKKQRELSTASEESSN